MKKVNLIASFALLMSIASAQPATPTMSSLIGSLYTRTVNAICENPWGTAFLVGSTAFAYNVLHQPYTLYVATQETFSKLADGTTCHRAVATSKIYNFKLFSSAKKAAHQALKNKNVTQVLLCTRSFSFKKCQFVYQWHAITLNEKSTTTLTLVDPKTFTSTSPCWLTFKPGQVGFVETTSTRTV